MHPRLRLWLVGGIGGVLAVAVACGIADESYLLVRLLALIVLWVVAEWIHGPLPEAWLLAWALLGYILGNRGFAQTSLSHDIPLLPAEAVLLVSVPALMARMALGQVQALYRDGLNYALFAWILLGTARLPLDVAHHGFYAIRDFAMVYYAVFFFLAQAWAGHAASIRLLRTTLTVTFIVLPVIAAIEQWVPGFLLNNVTIRGNPLIYHKSDLLAAYLGGGFFWLWTRWEKTRVKLWLVPAAANLLMLGATPSARAAMVGLFLVTVMWLVARRWRIAAAQVLIVGGAAAAVLFVSILTNKNFRQTAVYSAYEHATSIFDVEAKGSYVNEESGNPGLNNRFRLTWWATVIRDTSAQNPVFGLGFGYDLAARFLVEYEMLGAEDFSTRSPHSMVVSVFGRMGALGFVLWLAIALGMLNLTVRCFRVGDFDAIGLVCIAWVMWFSSCLGVVLEGPMGAVVFWTVLGLANRSLADIRAEEPEPAADLQPALPADEVPASS